MADAVVLIVDDDRTIVRLCQRLLERASYQVLTAMDPLEALRILERQKVNLLLSDIRMPIMDGFELISQAKQLQPDLPVLVMTGYGSIDTAIQALHRGVDGLILKPFENATELVQTVQRVLDETQQRRDAARLHVLRPLFDVTERLLAETSPQPLEKLILNTATGLFQVSNAWIYCLDPDDLGLTLVRSTETNPSVADQVAQVQFVQTVMGEGSAMTINASGPGSSDEIQAALQSLGWETLLLASVRQNNRQYVFCANRDKGSVFFTEADLELFVIFARQAAVALENARLYSELKDYVQQVEESQRALIKAEKMAAMGRLMASLAHEINNPLQSIRNCLNLAAREDIDADQRFRYIAMTDGELDRLAKTVRQMLDFYRPGGVEKRRADIHQMIDQVLALLGPQLNERRIHLQVQYHGEPVPVYVVQDQIIQVLFNLLLNAIDAIEDWAASKPIDKEIWIDVYYESQQTRILVEDSGPGIPADLQEHIFEPFVSTKQQGTGLGLAVSYGIIERHQGVLSVISPRYKTGACFEVALPNGVEGENGKDINRR